MTVFWKKFRWLSSTALLSSLLIHMRLLHCSCFSILGMVCWWMQFIFIFLLRIVQQLLTKILTVDQLHSLLLLSHIVLVPKFCTCPLCAMSSSNSQLPLNLWSHSKQLWQRCHWFILHVHCLKYLQCFCYWFSQLLAVFNVGGIFPHF